MKIHKKLFSGIPAISHFVLYLRNYKEFEAEISDLEIEKYELSLETSLICILLSASRDVHFDKRMICFLSVLL